MGCSIDMRGNAFGELQNEKLPCQEDYIPPNYAYPIAGAIGMQELIGTFIDLNEDAELDKMPSESQQVFVDTIEFTTAVSGTASPHVEIASAAGLGASMGQLVSKPLASEATFTR